MRIWTGRIVMDGFETPIMIRRGGREIKKSCYDMMRTFQHNSYIPHMGFFTDTSNMGRLAIPIVSASFSRWVRNDGEGLLFEENGDMSVLFRTMIIDLCDLIKCLHTEKAIMIKHLEVGNLYLANEVDPRILLLVTEVEDKSAANNIELLKPVQEIVNCLRNYPHNWDYHTKGEYLVSVLAAHYNLIWKSMDQIKVSWPRQNGVLPYVLVEIIKHQESRGSHYLPSIDFHYLVLIRDTFKHFFSYPQQLQELLVSKEHFIALVDQLSPNIWLNLYDVIGNIYTLNSPYVLNSFFCIAV
ncbi:hypothetical protein EJB05_04020 [Eragrostis curvula]|uniref:Uncharacterized protein n=1 Tax=Eragrostis curvula TaxID=38414 RepID=A0A5J9W9J7_9POAL|nr:hypothetical protein EJB05_04020 [Eragrostis curvula]